jgi:hypothetical protein
MLDMAKKKPKGGDRDRHQARALVGIPLDVHQQLKRLAEKNNRPLTWELRAALVKFLEENGMWPPPPE